MQKHERQYDEAPHLFESIPEKLCRLQEIVLLKGLLALSAEQLRGEDIAEIQARLEAEPNDLNLQNHWVLYLVLQGQYEAALLQLLAMMDIYKTYNENYPQQACSACSVYWATVIHYRRIIAASLCIMRIKAPGTVSLFTRRI